MKKRLEKYIFWFTSLILGGFFIFISVGRAANSDVIINEIGASPTSTHEWVEIWNKGNDPVDMTGWKFWENSTNHGLSVSTTDAIIGPGEYAAICQDADQFLLDYPSFGGSIFDSSWATLNESGEEIGLKDADGNFVENFTYIAAPTYSLERRDPYLADYTSVNWQEHPSGNSVGSVNSNFFVNSTSTPDPTTSTPEITSSTTSTASEVGWWQVVKLNEIMPDPESGNEWVELFNTATDSVIIADGLICDATDSSCKTATGTIAGRGWLFVDLLTNRYLNNDGDTVTLKNASNTVVDQVQYGGGNVSIPNKGYAIARISDGADTDHSSDWTVTTQPTPSTTNIIVAPPAPTSGTGGGVSGGTTVASVVVPTTVNTAVKLTTTSTRITFPSAIVLNELLPNPTGADAADEFIEIKNISHSAVDLRGFALATTIKSFVLDGQILPGEVRVFARSITGITLRNSGDTRVAILGSNGQVYDEVTYHDAPTGQSYNRDNNNAWHWSSVITKNSANIIVEGVATLTTEKIIAPVWRLDVPEFVRPEENVAFSAAGTADPRGGEFVFMWNFGDGAVALGSDVTHSYATSGVFQVMVSATSSAGTVGNKMMALTVDAKAPLNSAAVYISEIFPNPDGQDKEEFIELFNDTTTSVDISVWALRHGTATYELPPSTVISAQGFLTFRKAVTRFSLVNGGDSVQLLSPRRALIDSVRFGKAPSGKSYARVNGEWRWLDTASPGGATPSAVVLSSENIISAAVPKAKNMRALRVLDIASARTAEVGDRVRVEGVVSVLPSIFGSQYFYIASASSGIQVYMYSKDFPPLKIGDKVVVTGEISVASGRPRIKVKIQKDIDILSTNNRVPVNVLESNVLDEDFLGAVVQVQGEVVELKSKTMIITDNQGEIAVAIKNSNVNNQKIKTGDVIRLRGVLELGKNGVEVWWGDAYDMEVVQPLQVGVENKNNTSQNYLAVTEGGVVALLLGWVVRARGMIAFAFVKRGVKTVAQVASNLIRRG